MFLKLLTCRYDQSSWDGYDFYYYFQCRTAIINACLHIIFIMISITFYFLDADNHVLLQLKRALRRIIKTKHKENTSSKTLRPQPHGPQTSAVCVCVSAYVCAST